MANDAASPALQRVRETDRDRYLTLLYAPAETRDALACLYAFDREIATIRDRVRDALPGELRLRWWQDTIDAGAATGNPLANQLVGVIQRHRLPKAAFANYLEARIFDVYNDPMPSRTDFEGYCGETAGAIIQFACLILDADAASLAAAAAGHAGCAQATTAILRTIPAQRARGQCFFPVDLLEAAGTTPEAFLMDETSAATDAAILAMTALTFGHMKAFRLAARSLPATFRPAFLPLAVTDVQLAKIRKSGSIAGGVAEPSPLSRQWSVMRRAMRGW